MALLSERALRARASGFTKIAEGNLKKSLRDHAASGAEFDVFLSHSALDQDVVRGLWRSLEEDFGFAVYVDWIVDPDLDRTKVNATTAERLRARLLQSKALLYASSVNSTESKWMPWELGFFDGLRSRAAVLPVSKTPQPDSAHKGIEYLGLYPYVSEERIKGSDNTTLWVNANKTTYTTLRQWVAGQDPIPVE
ncbi:toll/interleukin-1 receptor domain-containing protein [Anaeromyxobacter sp. Fw109-5]|uniref:toll/interleukin-1 receptor domain-containing protein n=1 Tax=Anaeromyxobacter sp. (strain Fw109-5) TaxID=404589 RepID=UPI0000ED6DC5|nr:toll/interleukin-1 receptor domain-containing protein [Anaeromyxobacter sp. Fw109-5]ABS28179.1 conserved hypothetical protein [Anaeromyxobacter sp. Fw109-5]